MNKKLFDFLVAHGLDAGASWSDAIRYHATLAGTLRAQADVLADEVPPVVDPNAAPVVDPIVAAPVVDPIVAAPVVDPNAAPVVAPIVAGAPAMVTEVDAERARALAIHGIAEQTGQDPAFARTHIASGASVQQVQATALASIAAQNRPLSVTVGSDLNFDSLGPAIEDAIAIRADLQLNGQVIAEDPDHPARAGQLGAVGMSREKDAHNNVRFVALRRDPHPRANEFRGRRIVTVGRQWLTALGITDHLTMGDYEVAQMLFNPQAIAHGLSGMMMAHSTSDFPNLLANVANKTLRSSYVEAPVGWPTWCRAVTNPDLKTVDRLAFGEAGNLDEIAEGGEYTEVKIAETKESYKLAKFGKQFTITLELVINDDLGAISRLPAMLGAAARRTEDVIAYAIITTNAVMGDGNAIFSGAHSNIVTAGGPPTTARISALSALMRKQTGIDTDAMLNIQPIILMAPVALQHDVLVILTSMADPAGTHAGVANIWQGQLIPNFHPLLDADSLLKWYLIASTSQIDTVEMAFLEGAQQPFVGQVDNPKVDGRTYNVRHFVAAKAIDHRGLAQDDGAT